MHKTFKKCYAQKQKSRRTAYRAILRDFLEVCAAKKIPACNARKIAKEKAGPETRIISRLSLGLRCKKDVLAFFVDNMKPTYPRKRLAASRNAPSAFTNSAGAARLFAQKEEPWIG